MCEEAVRCGKTVRLLQLLGPTLPVSQACYRCCLPLSADADADADGGAHARAAVDAGSVDVGVGVGAGAGAGAMAPMVIEVAFTEAGVERAQEQCASVTRAQAIVQIRRRARE